MLEPTLAHAMMRLWTDYQEACTEHWVSTHKVQWRWYGTFLDLSLNLGRAIHFKHLDSGNLGATPSGASLDANSTAPSNIIHFPSSRG